MKTLFKWLLSRVQNTTFWLSFLLFYERPILSFNILETCQALICQTLRKKLFNLLMSGGHWIWQKWKNCPGGFTDGQYKGFFGAVFKKPPAILGLGPMPQFVFLTGVCAAGSGLVKGP